MKKIEIKDNIKKRIEENLIKSGLFLILRNT
jgi:hypothetical protein